MANAEVNEEVLKAREKFTNTSHPLLAASTAVKHAPYQSADGLWHYYDPEAKQWKVSKEDPHLIAERKKSEENITLQAIKEIEAQAEEITEGKEEIDKKEEEMVNLIKIE